MTDYREYNCGTILNKGTRTGFAGSVNPYRGCEHTCVYCYAQGDRYTPCKAEGADRFFETVQIKTNAPGLLERALARTAPGIIMLGTSTDPYQPVERETRLTRRLLEVVLAHPGFGVHVFTKSGMVLRDADLLGELARRSFAAVSFSMASLNSIVQPLLEPRAPAPRERLQAMARLSAEGIPAGTALMPVLPCITDGRDIDLIARETKRNGGRYLWGGGLTLRDRQRDAFMAFLRARFPSIGRRYRELFAKAGERAGRLERSVEDRIAGLCAREGLRTAPPFENYRTPEDTGQMEFPFDISVPKSYN